MDKKVCVDSLLTWWLCVVRACACLCVLVRACCVSHVQGEVFVDYNGWDDQWNEYVL